ncbi:hypothetical protein C8R42DRAFT_728615 [Lentinula raphanica]|nr:hypothetical protein C8R42DRAFT_728615 [Lentinula raphanica]
MLQTTTRGTNRLPCYLIRKDGSRQPNGDILSLSYSHLWVTVIKTFESQTEILELSILWMREDPRSIKFRSQFYLNYVLLVSNSFGLQDTLERSSDGSFLHTVSLVCYLDNEQSAIALIKDVADVLESNSVNSTLTAPS